MTVILIWFDHGDRSETGSSAVSSVISRWSRPISRAPPGPATGDGEMELTRRRKLSETLGWGLGSERPDREETRCVARDISSIYSIDNDFSLHLRTSSCLLLLLILSTFICDFCANISFHISGRQETFGLSFSSNFLSCLNFAGTKVSCELFRSRPLIKNRVR